MTKLAFTCILALLVCVHLSNSYPLKSIEDVKTVKSVDNSVSKGESSEDGKGDKEKVVKDVESEKGEKLGDKKKEEDNELKPKVEDKDKKLPGKEGTRVEKGEKCAKLKCLKTPQEVECKVHSVPSQFAEMTTDCCPAHICRRPDGSTYFHYGFEIEESSPSRGMIANSERYANGPFQIPLQFQQGQFIPQPFMPQLPGPPPSMFAFNFGRPSIQQRGPPQSFPFQFQGPFGIPPFSPQQNIRGPQPSTSFTAVTITDNMMPVDRSVRSAGPQGQFSAFPGPYSRQDVGVPFGLEPVIRERRNVDFGQGNSGVMPIRPAGFSPGGQLASVINF